MSGDVVSRTYPEAGNLVAVVGMAGRFPGARDVDELWRNLRDGVESVTFFGEEELAAAGVDPERLRRPEYVAARGLLEGIDEFDAGFFGYSPLEARIMDPQQRIFLQAAWHALEDAGYGGAAGSGAGSDRGTVGLYAACGLNNYLLTHLLRNPTVLAQAGEGFVRVANRLDNLATRTAYKLDLRGPAINVQTGCSSSLVAVHLACQSLLGGESDLALAGGIRINLLSREGYLHEEGSVLSPDGHTRTFDAGARGTIAADGVGVVVLKRLDEAVEDGDTVRAVILGSAANNDGSEKIGYTAPSVEGQARVVSEALAMAGVEADSLSYVECHGTATPLGDPIEVVGLTRAFRATTERRGFCALGSVKSNFGHLDTAAGVAGLIKTVLALEHEALPPSLHFQTPNPEIDFATSPFRVVDRLTPWPRGAAPRRAGVSSFGIGGTNVHVVAQEAPPAPAPEPSRSWQLLALSARSPRALEEGATALGDHLRERSELHLADVAHTLAAGRRAFEHRRVLVVSNREEAVAGLGGDAVPTGAAGAAFDLAGQTASVEDSAVLARPVAFLFPGQGAQRPGMAVDLYRQEPTFRADLERCGELLAPHLERGLAELLAPAPGDGDGALADTEGVQPALFAVEWALARLFLRWGVRPAALAGHSLGEYVAACLAGVLSLPDALALVATRGRLMQDLPPGAMLVVPLAEAEVRERLGDGLELAAVNGPALCVVTGEVEAVAELEEALRAEGLEPRRLRTRRAFHSALVEPMMEPFAQALQQVELRPPEIPFLSNVTGTWITPAQATDPDYWLRHLRRPVRFGDCLEELLAEPGRVLLEVGPGRTLCTLARRNGAWAPGHLAVPTLPGSADAPEGLAPVLAAAGRLWCGGAEVDLAALHGGERRRRVPLPGYPFERQSYWVEPEPGASFGARGRRAGAERRPDPAEWFHAPSWKRLPPARPGSDPGTAWLVLTDGAAGEALARELARRASRRPEAHGGTEDGGTEVGGTEVVETVVTVRPAPGAGLERIGDHQWALDPADGEAYRHLLSVLTEDGLAPDRVVHAWSWSAGADADSGDDSGGRADADAFDQRQEMGFHSLVHLVRALTDPGVAAPRRLVVVSGGLDDVLGGEPVDPAALPLLGVARALPYEHPEIDCRVVDAGPAAVAEEEGRLALLADEVGAATAPAQVALRNGVRWGRHHEPLPLGPVEGLPSRLRPGGVYLLFGGLGRIGLELAGWLVEEAGARLVLAGRSLPPGEDAEGDERARLQDAWLEEHGTDDPGSRRISRLRELRRAGAEVVTCAADVTDPESVRRAVELARQRFGALHGVVHGAGTTRTFDPLRETTAATAAVHFRPKAHGALALRSALDGEGEGGEGPDFVLLLSSLSAAVGGVGYAAHAAAHAALDAFALDASRRAAGGGGGTPWLSVGLDGWAFGKRGDTGGSAASGRRGGARFALAPAEGVEVIRRFLDGAPVAHLVVSTADLEERAAVRPAAAAEVGGEPDAEPGAGDAGQHARPALTTAYVAPEGETEELIAALWQVLLGVDRVGVRDDFFELGGHSLLGVQLVSRLREAFHVEIPMRRVMEQTTVRGLAGTVEEALLAEIEQLSDEEAERLLEEAH